MTAEEIRELESKLASSEFPAEFRHVERIASTHSWVKQSAAEAPHGLLLLAGAQSSGRGRGLHTWYSPPGTGLYFSFLLKPSPGQIDARRLGPFNLLFAKRIADAIHAAAGVQCVLKWPNDLFLGKQKVGGVLVEAATRGAFVQHLIASAGVNVHTPEGGFPGDLAASATALDAHASAKLEPARILEAIAAGVGTLWRELPSLDAEHALQGWLEISLQRPGESVTIRRGESTITGICQGLSPEGLLLLERCDGQVVAVDGEILLEEDQT